MRLLPVLLVVFAVTVAAVPKQQACQPPYDTLTFCDTSLSIEQRVADLLSQMTTAEKISQTGNTATGVSRLGVPHYEWWSEALHGVNCNCWTGTSGSRCPTTYPTAQNLAATFNMGLVNQIGAAISDEARAAYALGVTEGYPGYAYGPDVWTPNLNIFRDPRWGRGQETPGEDPFLSGQYAVAMIKGLQETTDKRYYKLASTAKHFAAYSLESFNGMDRFHFNANVSKQDLFQTFYPAFQTAVEQADVQGIMCSYNSINGVPACADTNMLTTLLRDTWGFDGYVTGDCDAVSDIYRTHQYTTSDAQTVQAAMSAGTDTDCGGEYQSHMQQAYDQKLINDTDIDKILTHTYTILMRLGVFDPWEDQPWAKFDQTMLDAPEHRQLALQSARESIILLKNEEDTLPLKPNTAEPLKVALIGPHATSTDQLCSEYHGSLPHVVSIQEAFNSVKGITVTYVQGCDISGSSTSGFAAAVAAAEAADVAVVALGITTNQENEGRDRSGIKLPGVQDQLLQQLLAAQPNLVVVLVNGGMVAMDTIVQAPAILETYYPGEEGGQGIADVIFGAYNPSGRVVSTIYPASFATDSNFYNYDMRKAPGLTYRFYQPAPVFEFGHGLSYTTFSYTMLTGTQTVSAKVDAKAVFQVTVKNTGTVSGDVSVLGFLSLSSTATRRAAAERQRRAREQLDSRQLVNTNCPLKQLFEFQKVTLAPGASTTLSFTATPGGAMCVDATGTLYAQTGTYTVTLGEAKGTLVVVP